jgi:hypothetical protein
VPVGLNVVAGHDGERRDPRRPPPGRRLDQEAEDGARPIRVGEVGHHARWAGVELAGHSVQVVAGLGERQRDDPDLRRGRARLSASGARTLAAA